MFRTVFLLIAALLLLAPTAISARAEGSLSFTSQAFAKTADSAIAATADANRAPQLAGSSHRLFSFASMIGVTYGMRPGDTFTSGLLGGLLGAGVGGLLFGGGFFGPMHGGSGVLGVLLQLLIIYAVAGWLYRRFTENLLPAGGLYGRLLYAAPATPRGGWLLQGVARPGLFGGGRKGRPIGISPADYQSFEEVLHCVQAAWSMQDVTALRSLATPEMTAAFARQLNEQANRGRRSQISAVRLHQSVLSDAWAEGSRDYATVQLRFSMVDVTLDSVGRVLDGNLTEHVTVTEIWTFLRERRARWVVSNIQQPK